MVKPFEAFVTVMSTNSYVEPPKSESYGAAKSGEADDAAADDDDDDEAEGDEDEDSEEEEEEDDE